MGECQGTPAERIVVLVGNQEDYVRWTESLSKGGATVVLVPTPEAARRLLDFPPEHVSTGPSIGAFRLGVDLTTAGPGKPPASHIFVEKLVIDLAEHRVSWNEKQLHLSEQELMLLAALARRPGHACSFSELAEASGTVYIGDTNRIRSAIRRLRHKLKSSGTDVKIDAVQGFGFRLESESEHGSSRVATAG